MRSTCPAIGSGQFWPSCRFRMKPTKPLTWEIPMPDPRDNPAQDPAEGSRTVVERQLKREAGSRNRPQNEPAHGDKADEAKRHAEDGQRKRKGA
jgi:hypothetical protein